MNILYIMVPMALALAASFLFAFVWAAKKGQFDDTVTPAHRILFDDEKDKKNEK